VEGNWNTGKDILPDGKPNLGYLPRNKEGYFPVSPTDTYMNLRCEMTVELEKAGIPVELHHHEVATGGQCEIGMRFSTLSAVGDQLMLFKYILKNVARRHGKTVTFMPKPLFGDNGSGMHCHQSIWKDGKPLFAGDKYAGLSEMGLHYIGGILKHAKALAGFTNPTTNSYRRLVPGFEAPVNLAYSARNRSAAIRIPIVSSPKAKRIEVRFPDPSCNGYLAFAAMCMAGLDGIQNRIDPGQPLDKDIYALSPEEAANVPQMPGSLEESLTALQNDHAFLLKGDVFTEDVIKKWIEYKTEHELNPVRLRPVPQEFILYFDI
jgi:glutamine synthetase